ncbi:hypothetical protein CL655_00985 [bacterium]|nr:hypothetical protein [bacterium]
MQWSQFFALYAISLPVFLVVDLLWIGVFANSFYTNQIGHLRGDINWPAALAFYFIFLAGLTYFAVYPAATASSIATAALLGGLYGFFIYAAYDLTNMATLKDWPLLMTIVDMAWGMILGASVSALSVAVYLNFI